MLIPPGLTKSWMPTVSGLVSSAMSFVITAQLLGWMTFPKPLIAVALFAQIGGLASLGITAKQYNVTGGEIGQPSTPQALKDANAAPAKAPNAPEKPEPMDRAGKPLDA